MLHRTRSARLTLLALSAAVAFTGCRKEEKKADPAPAETPGETTEVKSQPETPAGSGDGMRVVMVTHGQAADPFWSVVKRGADQAQKDLGVTVEYQAPTTFDMVAMARLIDAAVASSPDGLVVSIPDADALRESISKAVKAGIPVISINSGSEVAKDLGLLTHVGQTEYEAGLGAGERMAKSGAKHGLCINHEVGNAAQDLRCKGFADAMEKAGGKVEVLAVDGANPTDTTQRITAALTSKGSVDSMLTLGPVSVNPALKALADTKKAGQAKLAMFDLTPEGLAGIRDGTILFAIDQQQYLQGYMPVVLLSLYKNNLNTPAYDVLRTGPGFVTQDNAAQVIELSKKGTR